MAYLILQNQSVWQTLTVCEKSSVLGVYFCGFLTFTGFMFRIYEFSNAEFKVFCL